MAFAAVTAPACHGTAPQYSIAALQQYNIAALQLYIIAAAKH
jgi:hypothetical protein